MSDVHPVDFNAPLGDLPHVGSVIDGKYVIEAVIGRGAMGAVYRAVHQFTGRRVALKWMLTDSADARRRFIREARTMGAIEHPQVVSVFDFGAHDGSVFLVMEFLEGASLRAHVGRRILPIAETIRLIMPALEGVAAAHLAGIVHRDIKPENLFVCIDRDGTAYDTRVLDLGIARSLRPKSNMDDKLTRSGVAIGTPRYMAPEQLRGSSDVDHRVDIFALGLVIYEMLAGRLPYQSESYESLVIDIVTGTPPSPRLFNSEIPEELARVVLKALARDAADRFENVGALAVALEPFGAGVRYKAPRSVHVRQSEVPSDPNSESFSSSDPAFNMIEGPALGPTVAARPGLRAVPEGTETDPMPRVSGPAIGVGMGTIAVPLRKSAAPVIAGGLLLIAAVLGVFFWSQSQKAASDAPSEPMTTPASATAPPTLATGASAIHVEVPPAPTAAVLVPPVAAESTQAEVAADAHDSSSGRHGSGSQLTHVTPPAPVAMTATPVATPLATSPPTTMNSSEAHGRAGVLRPDDF